MILKVAVHESGSSLLGLFRDLSSGAIVLSALGLVGEGRICRNLAVGL